MDKSAKADSLSGFKVLKQFGPLFCVNRSNGPNRERKVLAMATYGIRPLRVEGNLAYVPLTMGYEAVIDASDAPVVGSKNWSALKCKGGVYAVSKYKLLGKWRTVFLHRLVFVLDSEFDGDHKNGDSLDCRLSNLRQATRSQNNNNSRRPSNNKSGFKGVSLDKRTRRWRSEIKVNRKTTYLGSYPTPEEAHAAYMNAASRLQGEFANAG